MAVLPARHPATDTRASRRTARDRQHLGGKGDSTTSPHRSKVQELLLFAQKHTQNQAEKSPRR